MMRHYISLKEKYNDAIILYRLGDFYEMFFDDAKKVSSLLDLTLTGRDCGLEERAPMCGVPHHAVDTYVAKLISHGLKVAICEQLTTPDESKGMVERDVVRVITPGTVMEDTILDERKNNYLAALALDNNGEASISWVDISTGEFNTMCFGEQNIDEVEDMLITIAPAEIIANSNAKERFSALSSIKIGKLPPLSLYFDWAFDFYTAKKKLLTSLKVESLESFELEDKNICIISAGAILEYLSDTQKRSLDHINSVKFVADNSFMFLDGNTRRNLELTETIRDKKRKGSLLWVLDKTMTSMGARNIRKWVEQPLRDEKSINDRSGAVEEFVLSGRLRSEISETLKNINDVERISSRIAYGSISPKDCVALKSSLALMPGIKSLVAGMRSNEIKRVGSNIKNLSALTTLLDNAISDDVPTGLKELGFIKTGFSKELDELREIIDHSSSWIPEMEAREREAHGIKVKVSYNRVFGYYIEVPKSMSDKVPYNYIRKQTLANAERYITEELKELEDKILGAEEKAKKLESKIYDFVKSELSKNLNDIKLTAVAIAELDSLCSLATVAVENNYVRPKINAKVKNLIIENGRHPVVEKLLSGNEFVSNDTYLDTEKNRTMVITGPNMAGKSTYMRQVALITLMAHIGSFVPASNAEISLTDRIFTRVGASDDVAYGQSTFMVEMIEVATIIRNATNRSLLILDEIGRGTSTYDGLSIAWAVIEYISRNIQAKTLFSTHYHELTELEGLVEGIKNYRITVNELSGRIIFLHKIVRGGTNKSFGIEVASLAGIPAAVTDRAKEIARRLEEVNLGKDTNSIVLSATDLTKKNTAQLSFFENSVGEEIIAMLKKVNVDNMSPMNALMLVAELKEKVR